MATAFQPLSSEIGRCCHIRLLAHSFLKWRTDCWLLRMSEIAWTCHSVMTPPTETLQSGRGKVAGAGGDKVWRVHAHLMTTAFPTFASEIIKQQKSSPWIIDSCAFCSDLNNRKPSLTHVFTVFCPLSHASWDAAYPPRFTPPHPPHTPQPFSTLLSTGIAVDKSGLIYFVDGTTIRKVDRNGIISTFLGSNDLTSARPLTCDSMDINQVIFRHDAVRQRLILHVRASRSTSARMPSGPAHTALTHCSDARPYISAFVFPSC